MTRGRPYPQFDSDRPQLQLISPNWGLSNYHAFTFKSEKRFSSGIGWMLAYTWSIWIDNVTFTGGDDATWGDDDQVQSIYDLRHERSLSTNHVPLQRHPVHQAEDRGVGADAERQAAGGNGGGFEIFPQYAPGVEEVLESGPRKSLLVTCADAFPPADERERRRSRRGDPASISPSRRA